MFWVYDSIYILNVHVLGKPYNQRESVGHEKGPASKVLLQIIKSIRAPFEAPSVQPRHGVISSKDVHPDHILMEFQKTYQRPRLTSSFKENPADHLHQVIGNFNVQEDSDIRWECVYYSDAFIWGSSCVVLFFLSLVSHFATLVLGFFRRGFNEATLSMQRTCTGCVDQGGVL